MLRYILLLQFLIFACSLSFSQDLLVTNNGDSISISVIEFKEEFLVYNKIESPDKVIISKYNILNKILYENGDVYIFKTGVRKKRRAKKEYSDKLKNTAEEIGLLYFEDDFLAPSIKTVDSPLTSRDVINIYQLMESKGAERLFKRGRNLNKAGNILGIPSGFFLGNEISKAIRSDRETNKTILISSATLSIISIAFNGIGVKMIKDSVQSYNDDVLFQLGGTENGIGLLMSF